MTNHLNLFAPVARTAMPTLSAGPIKHAHKVRRTGHSQPPVVDELLATITDGILWRRDQRQSAATLARLAAIASTAPIGAWIERP
jgi:hypothetical protein